MSFHDTDIISTNDFDKLRSLAAVCGLNVEALKAELHELHNCSDLKAANLGKRSTAWSTSSWKEIGSMVSTAMLSDESVLVATSIKR